MKQIALMILKGTILDWLSNRALVIPEATKQAKLKRWGISANTYEMIKSDLIKSATDNIDKILK